MSSTSGSTVDSSMSGSWTRCGSRRQDSVSGSRWDGVNIATMVLAFVFFPPLGLLVLAWILIGRDVRDLPAAARSLYLRFFGKDDTSVSAASNNIVFNEYQQTQYDRISEIKNEIGERARRFKEFRDNVQRRTDQEEFDRFMANAPRSSSSGE